ncbi:hypothetical protein ABIE50_002005 [Chitinophaga sp. OAE865]
MTLLLQLKLTEIKKAEFLRLLIFLRTLQYYFVARSGFEPLTFGL